MAVALTRAKIYKREGHSRKYQGKMIIMRALYYLRMLKYKKKRCETRENTGGLSLAFSWLIR